MSEINTRPIESNHSRSGHRVNTRTDTRNALVWCGTELLTERGFQITGIDEVLKRVGVPKGSFYHYFKSKDHFGHAVIDNYETYYAKKMDRIFNDPSQTPLQRLVNFTVNAKLAIWVKSWPPSIRSSVNVLRRSWCHGRNGSPSA